MDLQEILGYYNRYEIPNIPLPFKTAHMVLLWLASSLTELFQRTSILVTTWSPYSYKSLWLVVLCTFKIRLSSWAFNGSLNLGMFLDPRALIWFLNHWNCWLLHLWFLNHWNLDFRFLNGELLSGSLYCCIKNWLLVLRHEIHRILHLGFLGDNLYWYIKGWCSKLVL